MRINSVSCRQFAGLRNLNPVNFKDGMNVVYGPNESGKSTLIGLIYGLLWQGCKIDGRRDKEYKSLFFPAEVKSGPRGSTIDGRLVVDGEDGQYTITKKWSASGSGEIETPTTALLDEISDENAYAETMKKLLKYGQGVYREAIFANQKSIDSVLKSLMGGSLESDLSSVASSAMLDMGGISSEKFLAVIEQKLKALEDSWDWSTNGPKGGRGIDNKIGRNVGLILKSYYELEEKKRKINDLRAKTEAVGIAAKAYEEALERYSAAKNNNDEFSQYYTLLVNYMNTSKLKEAAEIELKRRVEADENWPELLKNITKAKELKEESERAETIRLWKQIEDIISRDKEVEKAIQNICLIPDNEVKQSVSLSKEIENDEIKLKSFNALISFSLNEEYELIATSEIDGHSIDFDDGRMELSEAVRLEIPGVAVFHMSAADINVEEITRELEEKREALNNILEQYKVESADELKKLQMEYVRRNDELGRERKALASEKKRILGGNDEESVKNAFEKARLTSTRDIATIEAEIKAVTAKPVGTFISLTEQRIDDYASEFNSIEDNAREIEGIKERSARYTEEISSANQIPEEFKNIQDPKMRQQQLKQELEKAASNKEDASKNLADARAIIKAAEESDDYMGLDELSESVADCEAEFNRLKDEYADWKKIKSTAEDILNESGGNPLQSFEEDFRKYLAVLSDDGVTLDSVSKKLKADIYSGDNKMTFDLLSEGTKDTVSLAFRLAVINFLFPDGGGLAVFDDPFTDMDEVRRKRACQLLKEFSEKNQVIFVTCDRKYIDELGGNVINF